MCFDWLCKLSSIAALSANSLVNSLALRYNFQKVRSQLLAISCPADLKLHLFGVQYSTSLWLVICMQSKKCCGYESLTHYVGNVSYHNRKYKICNVHNVCSWQNCRCGHRWHIASHLPDVKGCSIYLVHNFAVVRVLLLLLLILLLPYYETFHVKTERRPRHIGLRLRQDRDVGHSVRVETKTRHCGSWDLGHFPLPRQFVRKRLCSFAHGIW